MPTEPQEPRRRTAAWSRGARAALAAAPVALAGGVLLAPALFGAGALFRRDVLQQYWALRVIAARAFAAGHLPLWDPSQQAGLPLLANPHAAVLYPVHLLDQLVSFPRAYAWEVLFHLVVAGTGARALGRRLGLGPVAAAATGLAFALAGPVMSLVDFGPDLAGVAWIPWAVVALEAPWPGPRRAAALGAVLCLQALSGNPQAVVLSAIAVLAWVATHPGRRTGLAIAATGAGVGGLLAGVQLAPAWVLLRHSTRSAGLADLAWAFHPARLLGLATPYPFGRYLHAPWFWAHFLARGSPSPLPFDLSVYLGAAVLALALVGLGRDRATAFGLALVASGLLLGLGAHGPLGGLLRLPPLGYFRYPEKYLVVTALGSAILAGLGVARIAAGRCSRRRLAGVAAAFGALVVVAAGTWALAGPSRDAMASILHAAHGRAAPGEALAALRSALLQAGILGLLAVGAAAAPLGGLARLRGPLVAVVAATDLLVAAGPLVVTGPIALYRHTPPVVAELGRLAPTRPFRFLRDLRHLDVPLPAHPTLAGEIAARTHDLETLARGLAGVFGLEQTRGYGAVSLARWQQVALGLWPHPGRLATVFGACLALTRPGGGRYRNRTGFTPLVDASALGLAVYRTPHCTARLRSVASVEAVPDTRAAVAALAGPGFDAVTTATAEGIAPGAFAPATVRGLTSRPTRIAATVDASGRAFLLLSVSSYPGWVATVDGARVPIHVADGALMGIPVAPGRHRVAFTFHDPGLGAGLGTTGLGALLALGLLAWPAWRRRRAPAPD